LSASEAAERTAHHSAERHPDAGPAWRNGWAVTLFVVVCGAGLGADLLSKHYVFENLLNDPQLRQRAEHLRSTYRRQTGRDLKPSEALNLYSRPILPGVKLKLSTNPGIVFGMSMNRWIVSAVTIITIGVFAYFFAASPAGARSIPVACGLIIAGAAGNLYDRLLSSVTPPGFEAIRYQVRDFIDCSGLGYPWVFNLADAWLVIGIGILAASWLIRPGDDRHPRKQPAAGHEA